MPSPSLLDFEALVKPIPGDNPAGESVPFVTRKKLDDHRKEINPALFAADDPTRPEKPKFADWPAIISIGKETLTDVSKDLLVSARLTEALTKNDGFAGLRDGLKLMGLLVTECWDRIHPSIEDGDLEVRASAFNWLDDSERGARFPYSIRMVPLLVHGEKSYSWQDWRNAMDGKGKIDKAALDQVSGAMTYEEVKVVVDDLKEGLKNLDQLGETLAAKLADVAPGMVEVRRAMNEVLALAEQVLGKKLPPPTAIAPVAATPVEAGPAQGALEPQTVPGVVLQPVRRVETREDVYIQLGEISNKLLQLDPHSPITYLVQRAVKLSKLTLPQLLKELIRDSGSLSELDRDLGFSMDSNEPKE